MEKNLLNEIKALNEDAEKVLTDCHNLLKGNVFADYHNLKLYDVSWHGISEEKFPKLWEAIRIDRDLFYDLFNKFCEDSYTQFCDDLREIKAITFEDIIKRIGRTSSFYLTPCKEELSIDVLLFELYGDFSFLDFKFEDGKAHICFNYVEEIEDICDVIDCLEYIVKDFKTDYEKFIEPCVWAYEYIKDFKKNQVEYFENYLEFYEEDVEIITELVEVKKVIL